MINLLPWREQELNYQKKMLRRMLIFSALLGISINIVIHIILAKQEEVLRERVNINNEALTTKQIPADISTDHPSLNMTFIGKMFSSFEQKPKTLTCFTEIKQLEQTFLFKGIAESMQDLMQYFLHWKAADIFTDIHIKQILQQEDGRLQFIIEVKK